MTPRESILGLNSETLRVRLATLESLCDLERNEKLNLGGKIGPVLPNYIHVHTTASYGFILPGVHSASRMIWAAHEAQVQTVLLIEHESIAHMDEARAAAAIVNREASHPFRVIFGVEFKAPIAPVDVESRRFRRRIHEAWGQNEAAWVVAVGANLNPQLAHLVTRFQEAKRWKATRQLDKLSAHLGLLHPLELPKLLTPEGNVTDRSLSYALANTKWPKAGDQFLEKQARAIRKMLNPGGPGFVPFPKGLPSYQSLIRRLSEMGTIPTFTAQLRGKALEENLPALIAWGIAALDIAGIEPDEPDAEKQIYEYISQAEKNNLLIFGGADYRGFGTGWIKNAQWMDHPNFSLSLNALA